MAETRNVRILKSGRITIPKDFLDSLQLGADDQFAMTLREDGSLSIRVVREREIPAVLAQIRAERAPERKSAL